MLASRGRSFWEMTVTDVKPEHWAKICVCSVCWPSHSAREAPPRQQHPCLLSFFLSLFLPNVIRYLQRHIYTCHFRMAGGTCTRLTPPQQPIAPTPTPPTPSSLSYWSKEAGTCPINKGEKGEQGKRNGPHFAEVQCKKWRRRQSPHHHLTPPPPHPTLSKPPFDVWVCAGQR